MIEGNLKEYATRLGVDASDTALSMEFRGVSIDSRSVREGNLFICIAGERYDGHDFIEQAVAAGARLIMIDRQHLIDDNCYLNVGFIRVDDTLTAMGDLAGAYLEKINPRTVAVTGTNGKTTCKEFIARILSAKYHTCATCGNFNNLYGVPLSIFQFDADCEVAVLEFGMSTPGEIARLVDIIHPDVRVILNIGPAHLQTMKTIEAIAEAKFEILEKHRENDWAVLNMDDPQIKSRSDRYSLNKLTFGSLPENQIHPERTYSNGSGHAHLILEGIDIKVPVLGQHHLSNCLAAIAVAKIFNVPLTDVSKRLESFESSGFRMTTERIGGVTVINDAYNANPVSVIASIETASSIETRGKRVLVLGDMLELGNQADEYHRQVAKSLAGSRFDHVVLIGRFAELIRSTAVAAGFDQQAIVIANDHNEIVEILGRLLESGDLLLLKASRALALEKVETALRATLGRKN